MRVVLPPTKNNDEHVYTRYDDARAIKSYLPLANEFDDRLVNGRRHTLGQRKTRAVVVPQRRPELATLIVRPSDVSSVLRPSARTPEQRLGLRPPSAREAWGRHAHEPRCADLRRSIE